MKNSPAALLPMLLFLALFIGSGLYYQALNTDFAFYQISAPVAILPAIALALMLKAGSLSASSLNTRIDTFIRGVGDHTIVTMVLVYLLAGAFASVAKAVGGVDATVNFGLSVIPAQWVLPGLFIISGFVATAMGTSMGTIAAIAPVAMGLTDATDLPVLLTMGAVIGGAMFGDNLSIISDTTIAATRTQGCEMRDKFRMNLKIALPAAALTIGWLYLQGQGVQVTAPGEYDLIRVLPYLFVLALAVSGMNVMLVLFTGILLAGAVGLFMMPDYSVATWSKDIYAGYTGMQEILILSLLIGGLGALMKAHGGLDWLAEAINRVSKKGSVKAGEVSISASVALTNLCTANNTVSIVVAGGLAKDLAQRYGVDPRRSASLMDIFSCVVQGIIPWGAQMLLAASIAQISPIELVWAVQYCWLLGLMAVISIIWQLPRKNTLIKQ